MRATWLRAQGVPPHLIAPVMGHKDSRMVERVYGRLAIDDLAKRIEQALREDSGALLGRDASNGGEIEAANCTGTAERHGERCEPTSATVATIMLEAAQ